MKITLRKLTCKRCGNRLVLAWVGGWVPWYACPQCDRKELEDE